MDWSEPQVLGQLDLYEPFELRYTMKVCLLCLMLPTAWQVFKASEACDHQILWEAAGGIQHRNDGSH